MSTPGRWTVDHFIAGDVALDFANTIYRRTPELGPDLLNSAEELVGWFVHAGLLTAGGGGSAHVDLEETLQDVRTLRGLLWTLFEAQIDGRDVPVEALAGLLNMAQRDLTGDVSVATDGVITPHTVQGACAAIALHGVKLALSPPPRPVRTCDRCGWFFLDTSRGRRRRWCSMKTCGNQAKVARYRATHPDRAARTAIQAQAHAPPG